jgi:amidophosphoribosyltransferase
MSDSIKHECGVALLKLHKPLQYYIDKYNKPTFGLDKMYLLMEKQRNRGQDGSGIAVIRRDTDFGNDFIYRERSAESNSLQRIFENCYKQYNKLNPEKLNDASYLKENCEVFGDVFLGHLRYGTHGDLSEKVCHPFYRKSNWITRNLVLAGNFNLTNVDDLLQNLIQLGQHPRQKADTVLVLEKIGHFLDTEVQILFDQYKKEGLSNNQITERIASEINIESILNRSVKGFDGGYVMAGVLGHGDAFVFRDPNGIRPCFYYSNDEFTVVASERPAIQTVFKVDFEDIQELKPAHALILKNEKPVSVVKIQDEKERKSCSFERIYFARGTDGEIYKERKMLGKLLAPKLFDAIEGDFTHTVFSFIPNTSETAYYGMIKGLESIYRQQIVKSLQNEPNPDLTKLLVEDRIRAEKIIVKDVKLRTFITNDQSRNDLVSHVYDITYNSIEKHQDTICILDDSIVRGTTLKQSIISILGRLKPKKIIIVSSAPQIRFPDCYGIDMSNMGDLLIFKAAIELLQERGNTQLIQEVYQNCIAENQKPLAEIQNKVKDFYATFSEEELSRKAAQIVKPEDIDFEVDLIFQSLENLHIACPNDRGDWYFSGDYATPGGNKVANQAFINFVEKKTGRAY